MGFAYNLGHSLLYIGYAQTTAGIQGSDVIVDTPQSNETYLFEIVEGIPCTGIPVINYGGQTYTTIQIGNQCWMKENLNIGTMINGTQEQTNNDVIEKYCYNDMGSNCNIYGGLYQWNEMMKYTTIAGVRGVCPAAWHLPTDNEWTTLSTFLGGTSIAGGKMKETGLTHWTSPNTGATNESGFTALPAGYRGASVNFLELKISGSFWTSTQNNTIVAWCRYIYYNYEILYRSSYLGTHGWSVRCLKD
jgi:uncharacterized protein (TIGR02145 family)